VADGAAGTSNDDIKYARDLAPDFDDQDLRGHDDDTHTSPCWSRTSPASWPASPDCSRGAASTSTALAVGPTEHDDISRMTIVVNVEESPLEQVTKQLNKLVEVIKIVELDSAVARETHHGQGQGRPREPQQRLDVAKLFRGRSSTSHPTR
jgi:hypothetical protein